jgi:hypothetical protein
VTNQCGSDEFSRNIRIVENPEANFTIDPQFSCQPDTISPGIIDAAGNFNPYSAELAIGTYMVYVEYQRYDCSIRDSLFGYSWHLCRNWSLAQIPVYASAMAPCN